MVLSEDQDPTKCFYERPASKKFRLCWPYGLCHNYSTLLLQRKSSQRWYVNEWAWPCSSKIKFIDTELWISYNFSVSKNVVFLLIFFSQPFIDAKTSLTSWVVYQSRHQVWAMGHNLSMLLKIHEQTHLAGVSLSSSRRSSEWECSCSLVHIDSHRLTHTDFHRQSALTREPQMAPW